MVEKKKKGGSLSLEKVAKSFLAMALVIMANIAVWLIVGDFMGLSIMYTGYIAFGCLLVLVALAMSGYLLLTDGKTKPGPSVKCWCQLAELVGPFQTSQGDYYCMQVDETLDKLKKLEGPMGKEGPLTAAFSKLPKITEAGSYKIFIKKDKKQQFKAAAAPTILSPMLLENGLGEKMAEDLVMDISAAKQEAERNNGLADHLVEYLDPPPAYSDESLV